MFELLQTRRESVIDVWLYFSICGGPRNAANKIQTDVSGSLTAYRSVLISELAIQKYYKPGDF